MPPMISGDPDSGSLLFQIVVKDAGNSGVWKSMRDDAKLLEGGVTTANKSIQDMAKNAEQSSGRMSKALKDTGKEKDKLSKNFVSFGNIVKYIFGTVLGISAVQILYKLMNAFQELIREGLDYAKALYKLGASVRSLQKAGLDITMRGTLEQIKALREEFGVFSTKELIAGVAQMQLLTRQFGFTNEETIALTRSVAAMGVVLGKDFANTAASVALFLSSGYGEALQRAGIAVNRLAVVQEANRMGIKKSYTALTEYERAHAGYNLIIEQSKDIVEELTGFQKTYIGQIETQRAKVEDLKNALALGLIPTELAWQKIRLTGWNIVIKGLNALLDATAVYVGVIIGGIAAIALAWNELKDVITGKQTIGDLLIDQTKIFMQSVNAMIEAAQDVKIKPIDIDALMKFTGLDAGNEERAKKENEAAEEMLKITTDLVEELLDLQKNYADDSNKLWDNYAEDRNKIIADADEDLINAYEDLLSDLAKLEKDYNDAVREAKEDAQKKLADLQRETQDKISDSNKKYRDNEEKAERDHQERLRRLREEFLFALEDALRERDALQVLRLIRRYKLDKEQEDRAYKDKLADLQQQHKDELDEIRKSEADKRREIQESLREQLADLQRNLAEKTAEREAEYAKDIQEIKNNLDKELQARKDQYDKELQDLKDSYWGSGGKMEEMLTQWAKTHDLTEEQAKAVTDVLAQYFGELGISDAIFNYYKSAVAGIVANVQEQNRLLQLLAADALSLQQQITDAANAAAASMQSLNTIPHPSAPATKPGTMTPPPGLSPMGQVNWMYPPAYASGATNMILTRPKLIMAGEVPERIDITPLNQLGSKGNGKGILEILLSAGLEGRMVDNALEQVEIVFRKELERK